jgi:hypothetical protein
MDREVAKSRLLAVLTRHVGKQNAVSMVALHEAVFGQRVGDKINDSRALRELVDELQFEGSPVCSCQKGYFLAAAGSELDTFLGNLDRAGLRKLAKAAKIRKITLPEYLGQMRLRLVANPGEAAKIAGKTARSAR